MSDKKLVSSNNISKDKQPINLHANHRSRLRNRFLSEGLDSFEPHNILELLLFFSIPRIDTNPIAHKLLNEFGSLSGVLDAPYENLLEVDGVGESTATLIKLCHDLIKQYEIDKQSFTGMTDIDEISKYMVGYYKNQTVESFEVLLLDNDRRLFKIVKVAEGTVNSVNVSAKQISTVLHRYNASAFILAHNHPSGKAAPSNDDITMTVHFDSVFQALKYTLVEHIIVAGDKYCLTFRDSAVITSPPSVLITNTKKSPSKKSKNISN